MSSRIRHVWQAAAHIIGLSIPSPYAFVTGGFRIKFPSFIIILFVFQNLLQMEAANYCVRVGATGANNGSDWTNSYTFIPETLQRGSTYYIADGNYDGFNINTPLSSTNLITVKKATVADHGTSTGWNNAYGDGQAILTGCNIDVGYVTVDGQFEYGFKTPPDRMPTAGVWSSGVPGGIPTDYTMFCNVRVSIPGSSLVATGNGVTDDAPTIQAAVSACPNNQYVYIPEGNYRLNSNITRTGAPAFNDIQQPFSIIIRWDGPTKTKLFGYSGVNSQTAQGVFACHPDVWALVDPGVKEKFDVQRGDQAEIRRAGKELEEMPQKHAYLRAQLKLADEAAKQNIENH